MIGLILFTFSFAIISIAYIWNNDGYYSVPVEYRVIATAGIVILLLVIIILRDLWRFSYIQLAKLLFRKEMYSNEKKKNKRDNNIHPFASSLLRRLRQRYGLFWRHKARLLLVLGDEADISQQVPTLKHNLWLEGNRTVLIYGGSLTDEVDNEKYATL